MCVEDKVKMTYTLPPCQRLKREEDFKRLLKKGKKVRNSFFFLLFRK
jgi:ribonuclease P protein component